VNDASFVLAITVCKNEAGNIYFWIFFKVLAA